MAAGRLLRLIPLAILAVLLVFVIVAIRRDRHASEALAVAARRAAEAVAGAGWAEEQRAVEEAARLIEMAADQQCQCPADVADQEEGDDEAMTTFRQKDDASQKRKCSPETKIAFAKTHKTGSSTMQNILLRYGVKYDLVRADRDRDRQRRL